MRFDRACLSALAALSAALCAAPPVAAARHPHGAAPVHPTKRAATGDFVPLPAVPNNTATVTIGVQVLNIYDLDVASSDVDMTVYMWALWSGNLTDPTRTLEFVNAIDGGATVNRLSDEPAVYPGGVQYQELKVQGTFYQAFNLRSFPMDRQKLQLVIEDPELPASELIFLPDTKNSGHDRSIVVPGWSVLSMTIEPYLHDYGTNFGDPGSNSSERFSAILVTVTIARAQSNFAWKLVPLIFVLIVAWSSLFVHPKIVELRIGLCATALITCVFLQQTSIDPAIVSGLVLMDELYITAYVLVTFTFLQVLWDNAVFHAALDREEDERHALVGKEARDEDAGSEEGALWGPAPKFLKEGRWARGDPRSVLREVRRWDYISVGVQVVVAAITFAVLCSTAG
ncbi:hypothetical protein DFJ74DRAFT_666672 [Hyaloraphidium curvatum]|nr:hypothetical protein DFJ74DRAFT_666672 [Hyaloraphidium curvatum]